MERYTAEQFVDRWELVEVNGTKYFQKVTPSGKMNLFYHAKEEDGTWKLDARTEPFGFSELKKIKPSKTEPVYE